MCMGGGERGAGEAAILDLGPPLPCSQPPGPESEGSPGWGPWGLVGPASGDLAQPPPGQ